MTWFEKIMPSRIKTERRTRSVPEGLWIKCPACDAVLYRAELDRNLQVCPKCSHHMRIGARDRLSRFLDEGSQYIPLRTARVLKFVEEPVLEPLVESIAYGQAPILLISTMGEQFRDI